MQSSSTLCELPKYRLLLGKLNYACEIPKVYARASRSTTQMLYGNEALRSFSSDDISAVSRSVQIRLMCFKITFFLLCCFFYGLSSIAVAYSVVHLLISHSVYAR